MENKKLNIRIELQNELLKKFEAIKNFYGFERNTEVLRLLITQKFKDIQTQSKESI